MMAAAARGEFDVIVVFQTSRLWRNRRERAEGIELLRTARVSVAAVKGVSFDLTTAQGRGQAGILGEVDTMETEIKAERQQLANYMAVRGGKRLRSSQRPFGYEDDHVTERPAEADAIRWAADALLGGGSRDERPARVAAARPGHRADRPAVHPAVDYDDPAEPAARRAGRLPRRDPRGVQGEQAAILAEETWRAVDALLARPGAQAAARRADAARRAGHLPVRERGQRVDEPPPRPGVQLPVLDPRRSARPARRRPRRDRGRVGGAARAGGAVPPGAGGPDEPAAARGHGGAARRGRRDPRQPRRDGRRPGARADQPHPDARRHRAGERPAGRDRRRAGRDGGEGRPGPVHPRAGRRGSCGTAWTCPAAAR